jgi:hypothetical protein
VSPAGLYPTDLTSSSIVAVHGIGADPDETWLQAGVSWLEHVDMLPQAVPSARIMRFGYESRWLGPEAVKQRLSAVAERLLRSLLSSRRVSQFFIICSTGLTGDRTAKNGP